MNLKTSWKKSSKALTIFKSIVGFLQVFVAYNVGDVLSNFIPLPAPILGMAWMFVMLCCYDTNQVACIGVACRFTLKHMLMLFIPAGVGLLAYADLFLHNLPAIIVSMLAGWFLIIVLCSKLYVRIVLWMQSSGHQSP